MIIAMIEGATRICGKSQGYLSLPIRDEQTDAGNIMHSAWEPTPAEIELIRQGGKVIISIIGTSPQPMMVNVEKLTN